MIYFKVCAVLVQRKLHTRLEIEVTMITTRGGLYK